MELDPSAAIIHTDMSYVLLTLRQWDAARAEINKSNELDSTLSFNEGNLAQIFYEQGKYDSLQKADHGKTGVRTKLTRLAGLRKLGATARAQLLQDSIARVVTVPGADEDGTARALFYSVLAKPDSAFYWLNHMVDVKAGFLFTGGLPCYQAFEPLYADPRWDVLLKRINAIRCQR